MRLELSLDGWEAAGSLYFTVTSYKIGRQGGECEPSRSVCSCVSIAFPRYLSIYLFIYLSIYLSSWHPDWWNCNTGLADSPLLCINEKLTCNALPHCAKENIPNPDENCTYHVGMQVGTRGRGHVS